MAWELTYGTYNYPPMQTRTSVAVIYCRVKRERRCRNTEEMGPRRRPRKWGERGKEESCRSEEFHTMSTEIESWKILHLFIHSSSANHYFFLIRDVCGGWLESFPGVTGGLAGGHPGQVTRTTGLWRVLLQGDRAHLATLKSSNRAL